MWWCNISPDLLQDPLTAAQVCASTDDTTSCVAICPNEDISGVGVRSAFYIQSFMNSECSASHPFDCHSRMQTQVHVGRRDDGDNVLSMVPCNIDSIPGFDDADGMFAQLSSSYSRAGTLFQVLGPLP